MPDILHWLGITKIDRMLSMSNMKHDAIVEQGIPILERVPIPDDMIPEDSRVEIDAKIHAGYFTTGKVMTMEELSSVQGRAWDDVDVSPALPNRSCLLTFFFFCFGSTRFIRHTAAVRPSSHRCCVRRLAGGGVCDGILWIRLGAFLGHTLFAVYTWVQGFRLQTSENASCGPGALNLIIRVLPEQYVASVKYKRRMSRLARRATSSRNQRGWR